MDTPSSHDQNAVPIPANASDPAAMPDFNASAVAPIAQGLIGEHVGLGPTSGEATPSVTPITNSADTLPSEGEATPPESAAAPVDPAVAESPTPEVPASLPPPEPFSIAALQTPEPVEAMSESTALEPTVASVAPVEPPSVPVTGSVAPDEEKKPEKAGLPERSKVKKPLIMMAALAVVFLAGAAIAAAVFLTKPADAVSTDLKRPTSSPLGYLNGFEKLKSGRLHITTTNLAVIPDINQDYDFYVTDDGKVLINMLPDVSKANSFIKYLFQKGGASNAQYPDEMIDASQYMRLDMQSLLGYDVVRSTYPGLFNIYATTFADPAAYARLLSVNDDSQTLPAKPSDSCVSAAKLVTGDLDSKHFNTGLLKPKDIVIKNGQTIFDVDTGPLDEVNKGISTFIDQCYLANSKNKEVDKSYFNDNILKKLPTKMKYKFVASIKPKLHLQIFYQDADETLGKPIFDLTVDDTPPKASLPKGTVSKPLFDNENLFALAYQACRNAPVVVSDFTHGYHFLSTDAEYNYPSAFDSDYLCSTTDKRLDSYHKPDSITMSVSDKGTGTFDQGYIDELQKEHELGYRIEQSFVKNGYYPSLKDITSGKVDGLKDNAIKDASGRLIGAGDISYKPTPANCQKCTGYNLAYKFLYKPTNNTVSVEKNDYEHTK